MASTISITYKLQGNAKDLKALINDADGLKKAFNGAAVQAEQLPKKMGGLRSMAGSLTKSLGGMAAGLVSVGALVKGLSSAINTMKDFEKANSELASVLGKSVSEIDSLTESAMELGKRTSFTAAEVTARGNAQVYCRDNDAVVMLHDHSYGKFEAGTAHVYDFSEANGTFAECHTYNAAQVVINGGRLIDHGHRDPSGRFRLEGVPVGEDIEPCEKTWHDTDPHKDHDRHYAGGQAFEVAGNDL